MQCEEFRLNIDTAPADDFAGRAEHASGCEACASYAESATALEDLIGKALRIPVPDIAMPALSELTDNVVALPTRKARAAGRLPVWIGLAASVALAVFVGFRFQAADTSNAEFLAGEILAHMVHEDYSRVVTATPVSYGTLKSVTEASNTSVNPDLGLVSYAMSCEINGHSIPHLVVQGQNGPVTILILPNENIGEPFELNDENFHGTILPVGNGGSVAIIGRKGESFDDIRKKVGQTIRLSI